MGSLWSLHTSASFITWLTDKVWAMRVIQFFTVVDNEIIRFFIWTGYVQFILDVVLFIANQFNQDKMFISFNFVSETDRMQYQCRPVLLPLSSSVYCCSLQTHTDKQKVRQVWYWNQLQLHRNSAHFPLSSVQLPLYDKCHLLRLLHQHLQRLCLLIINSSLVLLSADCLCVCLPQSVLKGAKVEIIYKNYDKNGAQMEDRSCWLICCTN